MESQETDEELIARRLIGTQSFNEKMFIINRTLVELELRNNNNDHIYIRDNNGNDNRRSKDKCLMPEILNKLGIVHECGTTVHAYGEICFACSSFYWNLSRADPKVYGILSNGKPSKFHSTKCVIEQCHHLRLVIFDEFSSKPCTIYKFMKHTNTATNHVYTLSADKRDMLLTGCEDHTCNSCRDKYREDSVFTFLLCLKTIYAPLYQNKDLLKIINGLCQVEIIIHRPRSEFLLDKSKIHRCFDRRKLAALDYSNRLIDRFLDFLRDGKSVTDQKLLDSICTFLGGNSNLSAAEEVSHCLEMINKFESYIVSKSFCPEQLPPCMTAKMPKYQVSKNCLHYVDPLIRYLKTNGLKGISFNTKLVSSMCYPCYLENEVIINGARKTKE